MCGFTVVAPSAWSGLKSAPTRCTISATSQLSKTAGVTSVSAKMLLLYSKRVAGLRSSASSALALMPLALCTEKFHTRSQRPHPLPAISLRSGSHSAPSQSSAAVLIRLSASLYHLVLAPRRGRTLRSTPTNCVSHARRLSLGPAWRSTSPCATRPHRTPECLLL